MAECSAGLMLADVRLCVCLNADRGVTTYRYRVRTSSACHQPGCHHHIAAYRAELGLAISV
jgi:hypothetical protein